MTHVHMNSGSYSSLMKVLEGAEEVLNIENRRKLNQASRNSIYNQVAGLVSIHLSQLCPECAKPDNAGELLQKLSRVLTLSKKMEAIWYCFPSNCAERLHTQNEKLKAKLNVFRRICESYSGPVLDTQSTPSPSNTLRTPIPPANLNPQVTLAPVLSSDEKLRYVLDMLNRCEVFKHFPKECIAHSDYTIASQPTVNSPRFLIYVNIPRSNSIRLNILFQNNSSGEVYYIEHTRGEFSGETPEELEKNYTHWVLDIVKKIKEEPESEENKALESSEELANWYKQIKLFGDFFAGGASFISLDTQRRALLPQDKANNDSMET